MKSSHVITACVLVALALLIGWIARNTYWDEVTVPMPMKGEARTNSLYAAQRLAETLGATAQARRALSPLPEQDAVIYLSYWNWNLIPSRREQLQGWVEGGGRLVIDSSLIGGEELIERWAGIGRTKLPARSDDEDTDDEYIDDENTDDEDADEADIDRADSDDVGSGNADERDSDDRCVDLELDQSAGSDERAIYEICNVESNGRLTSRNPASWSLSDARGIQALRVDVGRGSVTMLNADPFRNRELFEADDALLFVAATRIERGDRIYFLSEEISPSLLQLMWMYAAPAVALALGVLVLALWRGSLRFGPPAATPDPARRSLAEQILGTGRFTVRFGGGRALHSAAVRALHEAAERRISGYGNLQGEERIAALARNTGLAEAALAETINYAGQRRADELRKALALLETARRRII